jgi:diguanylate cyclase (GGDEF)-like protein
MSENKTNLQNILSPSDIVSFLIIIAGILIAVLVEQPAMIIIGLSIAVIGIVALFMMISQRYSNYVERRTPAKNTQKSKSTSHKPDPEANLSKDIFDTSDNFDSSFNISGHARETTSQPVTFNKDKFEVPDYSMLSQDISGMRIIGKRKISPPVPNLDNEKSTVKPENKDSERIVPDITSLAQNTSTQIEDESINSQQDQISSAEEQNISHDSQIAIKSKEIKSTAKNIGLNVLYENIQNGNKILQSTRTEFSTLNIDALSALKSITKSKTSAFLVNNSVNNEIIIESIVCNSPDRINKSYKFDIKNDIISNIVNSGRGIVISSIQSSSELELLRIYQEIDNTKSFAAVPIKYQDTVIGVLSVDSDLEDAYTDDTLNELELYAKIFSFFVKNYTEKYDLIQKDSTLKAINTFSEKFSGNELDKQSIVNLLLSTLEDLFAFDIAGVVTYDLQSQSWLVNAINEPSRNGIRALDKEINIEDSEILSVLSEKEKILCVIDDKNKIRVYDDEKKRSSTYFAALPMLTATGHYGAIFMEGDELANFTASDMDIFRIISEHSSNVFEKIHLISLLQNSMLIDHSLGLLNPNAFYHRLDEEISRANDFATNLTVTFFRIDKYEALESDDYDRMRIVANHILDLIAKHLRKYDLFTRFDADIFAVGFLGLNIDQVKFDSEKLRNEIANSMLDIEGKKFNVTVSIGIASLTKGENLDTLMNNAYQALNIAINKTNFVAVFQ